MTHFYSSVSFIILTLFSIESYSQTNTFPASGNAGIGTTSPQFNLTIGGSIFGLQTGDVSPNSGYLRFGDNTGWKLHFGRGKESSVGPINNDINGVLMTIQDNGNVGIGISSPSHLLHLKSSTPYIAFEDTENTYGSYGTITQYQDGTMIFDANFNNTATPGSFMWRANGGNNVRIVINNSGNVGIGTLDPGSYKLNVNGYIHSNGIDELPTYPYTKSIVNGADAGSIILQAGSSPTYVSKISIAGRSAGSGIQFFTRNNEIVRVTDDGNVGIGTINPGSYKLNVVGNIRADEVVVNTTGADFVFEPDYKLRELDEIEKYIKEKKRLPDIAPATEMKENGINVSEMQTKLLQKIEELTLYLIELKKEIESLKQEKNQN